MIHSFTRLALLAGFLLALVSAVEAKKKKKKPEILPPAEKQENQQPLPGPRTVPEQVPPPSMTAPRLHYSYPRISRYEVWKNVEVDQFGRFRPVVIYSPYGSYYRYNGQPFPWASMYPGEFAPYIMGPAYRAAH
jgi:hypothetical protein